MNTISARICEAMEARGYKQTDLVRLTGIGKSSIFYYCNGEHEPKGKKLYAIAEALGVTPSWLLGADTDMEGKPTEDDDLYNIRERMRREPEQRVLFDLTRNASTEDLATINRMIKAYLNK